MFGPHVGGAKSEFVTCFLVMTLYGCSSYSVEFITKHFVFSLGDR